MRYSNALTRRAARLIPYICGLSFLFFCIPYLYLLQPELLAQIQHKLSDGQTSYNPLLGTLLTTFILTLSGILLQLFLRLPIRFLSLAWVPSIYVLALLTCMHFPQFPSDGGSVSYFLLIVFPLLYAIVLWLCLSYPDISGEQGSMARYVMPNILVLAVCFFYAGIVGNSSVEFHHELKAARLLKNGQYEEALQVGKNDASTTEYLTQVRCLAMVHNHTLGDDLFQYPVSKSFNLLPTKKDTTRVYVLAPIHRHFTDYRLALCLVNKNLKQFVHVLQNSTDSLSQELPRYYRQALVLYQHTINASELGYIDDEMETDYTDFHHIYFDFTLSPEVRKSRCKDLFGDTYWFYYFFR